MLPPQRAASGAEHLELDRLLASHGIDTVWVEPFARPLNPFAGGDSLLTSFDPLRALRVLLRERRADVVVAIFEGGALPLVLLRALAGFRVPCVVWDIGLTDTWRLRRRVLDAVVPRVDAILVLSAAQRTTIAERWGRTRGVEVLGHRVDTGFFAAQATPPSAGPVLLVGDDAGRDFETFLAAITGIDAGFLIRSRRLSAELALPPNVTVQRERLAATAFRALYEDCRFVVVPLHRTLNASGVSTILEAGAMGRAVIVSDNPAIRDFIVPDQTCLAVPCGDAGALRAAIRRLLAEPETCARLGANARRFMEQTCAPAVFAARFAAVLRAYARAGR